MGYSSGRNTTFCDESQNAATHSYASYYAASFLQLHSAALFGRCSPPLCVLLLVARGLFQPSRSAVSASDNSALAKLAIYSADFASADFAFRSTLLPFFGRLCLALSILLNCLRRSGSVLISVGRYLGLHSLSSSSADPSVQSPLFVGSAKGQYCPTSTE